ncbi:hypothetical protein OIO90_002302 [Microbotryomycetes sp. JL221]|nr:hypothetical protein OIO90_002302 [Microbotryomycetes sp. JL221]
MKSAPLIAIILLSLLAFSTILAFLVFSRFKFRSTPRSRSAPVDRAHEATMRAQAAVAAHVWAQSYDADRNRESTMDARPLTSERDTESIRTESRPPSYMSRANSLRKTMFGGYAGVTPISQQGPDGTRMFMNGWFGLDGTTSTPDVESNSSNLAGPTYARASSAERGQSYKQERDADDGLAEGESRFSRAKRASMRRVNQDSASPVACPSDP